MTPFAFGAAGTLRCDASPDGGVACALTVVSFQANGTFDALGRLAELVDLWDQLGPRVWDFFQDSPQVEALRVSTPRWRHRRTVQTCCLNPFC